MRIKTLTIKAFGKFKDETIQLEPGLNLVYGTNEAGKTTVQTFIQGMFFGFYKPYRKKKTYSEEYEKYMPWSQFDYSGSLVYETDGREIRLERNFLRAKDSLFIYDNTTGKIINDQFKYDGVIRQHLPLGNQGMTSVIYNNTVNMRQTVHDNESGSQDEVRDSYIEMQNSSGIEINFKGIARRLEEKKNNIGRSGQSKSRIGTAIRERDELQELLKEAEAAYAKVAENQEMITRNQRKMKRIEAENDYLSQESVVKRKKELLQSYEKINKLEKENNRLSKIIREDQIYEGYNYKTLEGLKAISNQVGRLSDQMDYIEKEMADASEHLKTIRQKEASKRKSLAGHALDNIAEDYEAFKKDQDEVEAVDTKSNIIINIIATLVTLLGMGLVGLANMGLMGTSQGIENLSLTVGVTLAIVGVVGLSFGISATLKKRRILNEKQLISVQEEILAKYNLKDGPSFDSFYKKAVRNQKELEQLQNECELIIVQHSRHQAGYEVLFEQRRGIMRELDKKLAEFQVPNIADYEERCEKGQQLEELKIRFNGNLRLLENLLETVNGGKTDDGQSVWQKASPKSEELLNLGKEIARLEGENSALTDGIGLPVEIQETIKSLDAQIQAFDTEIKACNAALEVLETVQKDSHLESAPELNKNIGKILETITQHYKGVKIDEAMKLKVVDPGGGDFKDAEQLSAGTMDQVHFAFRYGISDIISHEMPFILDEPFVRYDKKRKTQALKLLSELSSERQVILFTCDDDEENLLKSLGAPYHKINL
ncbi:MAG: AAA family ATPase [Acetobacterium sp.]|uniref:ATP-binding protein n=1 Tax=Acetobacterium sp. TaxID=1872094 RepID=UPI003241D18F